VAVSLRYMSRVSFIEEAQAGSGADNDSRGGGSVNERETHIYMARVYLAQARHSRRHSNWHAVLLKWVASRRLMARVSDIVQPAALQMELFA
jgi:hypothetical protein